MKKTLQFSLAALGLVCAPVFAQDAEEQQTEAQAEEARIPFADSVGIRDWRAEGRETIYLQDNHRQWYKAQLMAPAPGLPFVHFIGIDAGAIGTLDKFGAVYIDGIRYPLMSLVKVDGPPDKQD